VSGKLPREISLCHQQEEDDKYRERETTRLSECDSDFLVQLYRCGLSWCWVHGNQGHFV